MVSDQHECRCYLPLKPPPAGPYWVASVDAEPPVSVRAVAMLGRRRDLLRAERVDGAGWHVVGALASHHEITPPIPWAQVGLCWHNEEHPVVDVT